MCVHVCIYVHVYMCRCGVCVFVCKHLCICVMCDVCMIYIYHMNVCMCVWHVYVCGAFYMWCMYGLLYVECVCSWEDNLECISCRQLF